MLLLELFSGTGSVGKAFRELGWEVISLDADPKAGADITGDIMEWEPPEGLKPDFVWSSPPRTEFSRALTSRPRDLVAGLRIAERTLDLIERLRPKYWAMENPSTGLLPQQDRFRDLPCKLVTYCSYGMPYRKGTWVATNLGDLWDPRPCCSKTKSPCKALVGGRHIATAQRGPCRGNGSRQTQQQLYSIPHELVVEIARAATLGVLNQVGEQA